MHPACWTPAWAGMTWGKCKTLRSPTPCRRLDIREESWHCVHVFFGLQHPGELAELVTQFLFQDPSMPSFDFHQVDVFSSRVLRGNALAVVCGADGWSEADMAALARWTQLSETTFLLQPRHPEADYRVRIFTPGRELPFAGHPTLGSCFVWLATGGEPRGETIVQECSAGQVVIRRDQGRLAFKAPPTLRSGSLAPELLARIAMALGVSQTAITASQWVDNGPGWVGLMLGSRANCWPYTPTRRNWVACKWVSLRPGGPSVPWTTIPGSRCGPSCPWAAPLKTRSPAA